MSPSKSRRDRRISMRHQVADPTCTCDDVLAAGESGTAEQTSLGGHGKVTGFADSDRIGRHWTNDMDTVPAQGMDVRTRPHRTDGFRWT